MPLHEDSIKDIKSLLDLFPSLSFYDIIKVGYLLGIKNIYDEKSVLNDELYSALKNKFLQENRECKEKDTQDVNSTSKLIEIPEGSTSIEQLSQESGIDVNILVTTAIDMKIPDIFNTTSFTRNVFCRMIVKKVNRTLVESKEAVKLDNVEDKEESTKSIEMNSEDVTKNVEEEILLQSSAPKLIEVNETLDETDIPLTLPESISIEPKEDIKLDSVESNNETEAKVPEIQKIEEKIPELIVVIPPKKESPKRRETPKGAKTIEELSKESGIDIVTLVTTAQDLQISHIFNAKSFTTDAFCKNIVNTVRRNEEESQKQLELENVEVKTTLVLEIQEVKESQEEVIKRPSISLETMKYEKKLNRAFIFEAISLLGIKDINGNTIASREDIGNIYVYKDDSKKIIEKTNALNALNANRNNPIIKNKAVRLDSSRIPDDCMSIEQLSEEEGIEVAQLLTVAKELGFGYIYNKKSYTKKYICKEIIDKIKSLQEDRIDTLIECVEDKEAESLEKECQGDEVLPQQCVDASILMDEQTNISTDEDINKPIPKVVPEGSKTVEQLSQESGIDISTLIKAAQELGFEKVRYWDSHTYTRQCDNIVKYIKSASSVPPHNMTMRALSKEVDINTSELIRAAKELEIPYVFNFESYTNEYNCKLIVEKARTQTNKLRIVKKSKGGIFEEIIKKDTLVFIDTSSLMNVSMPKVIDVEIIPILKKYEKAVYIVDSVIHEILIKIRQTKSQELQDKAKVAQGLLSKLVEDDLYKIPETHSVNKCFADAELITIFSDLRLTYDLCLITNDNSNFKDGGLSNSILELQESTSIEAENIKKITVLYVEDDQLVEYSNDRSKEFELHKKAPLRVTL